MLLRTSQAIAQALNLKAGKPLKFRNQACYVEGIRFASKREAARYCELVMLQRADKIHRLTLQPRYELAVNGVVIGHYVGDFRYCPCELGSDWCAGEWVVEDAKGVRTDLYVWKRKHLKAQYGIDIVEV